jgi:hypothetical protein
MKNLDVDTSIPHPASAYLGVNKLVNDRTNKRSVRCDYATAVLVDVTGAWIERVHWYWGHFMRMDGIMCGAHYVEYWSPETTWRGEEMVG